MLLSLLLFTVRLVIVSHWHGNSIQNWSVAHFQFANEFDWIPNIFAMHILYFHLLLLLLLSFSHAKLYFLGYFIYCSIYYSFTLSLLSPFDFLYSIFSNVKKFLWSFSFFCVPKNKKELYYFDPVKVKSTDAQNAGKEDRMVLYVWKFFFTRFALLFCEYNFDCFGFLFIKSKTQFRAFHISTWNFSIYIQHIDNLARCYLFYQKNKMKLNENQLKYRKNNKKYIFCQIDFDRMCVRVCVRVWVWMCEYLQIKA